MGEPSQEQVEEMIAWGISNRWSEERILAHVAELERMTDEELAAVGVFPPPPKDKPLLPRQRSRSGGSGRTPNSPIRIWVSFCRPVCRHGHIADT